MAEMTNRELAKELLGYQIDIAGSQAVKDQPLIEAIERALDEKDAECRKTSDKYVDKAFIEGQREMRDRAAYLVTNWEGKIIPMIDAIRALPIKGE